MLFLAFVLLLYMCIHPESNSTLVCQNYWQRDVKRFLSFFFDSALSPSLVVVEGEGMPCWLISRKEPSSGKSHRSMTAVPLLSTVSNILPR